MAHSSIVSDTRPYLLSPPQVGHHPYGKTAVREADGIRALGEMLSLGQWNHELQKQASAALMTVSVEKESKVPVVKFAGESLVKLLKVGG